MSTHQTKPEKRFNQSIVVHGKYGLWLDTESCKGEGTVCFEVKGHHDAIITLRVEPRLDVVDGGPDNIAGLSFECEEAACKWLPTLPFSIVLGSHQNTKLKFCNDKDCVQLGCDTSRAALDPQSFRPYWINYTRSGISVGCGPPGCGSIFFQDVEIPRRPIFIGFFSLDLPVAFRNIVYSSPMPSHPLPCSSTYAGTLVDRCIRGLATSISTHNVCTILCTLHGLQALERSECSWSQAHLLWRDCITLLASRFTKIVKSAADEVAVLPAVVMQHTLASGALCAPELFIYRTIESWALGISTATRCFPFTCGNGDDLPACSQRTCKNELRESNYARVSGLNGALHPHDLLKCLQYIRFPLLHEADLEQVIQSPVWKLVDGIPGSNDLLDQVFEHRVLRRDSTLNTSASSSFHSSVESSLIGFVGVPLGEKYHNSVSVPLSGEPDDTGIEYIGQRRQVYVVRQRDLWRRWRWQLRCPADATAELLFEHPGDQNGVIHYLGTNKGQTKRFLNPHLSGEMTVSSSSAFSPDTDHAKLVGKGFHRSLCAHSNLSEKAYWEIDLRPHALVCLQYVIRMNDKTGYPRGWKLLASADGTEWRSIHVVQESQHFVRPGQYAAWPIQNPEMKWYSILRLVMTELASDGTKTLNVNYVELYGYIR